MASCYLHLLPEEERKPLLGSKKEDRLFSQKSFWSALVLLSAILVTLAIIYGYRQWPSLTEDCKPYNCSWAIDWRFSGCCSGWTDGDPCPAWMGADANCTYFWNVVIDEVASLWEWDLNWEAGANTCAPWWDIPNADDCCYASNSTSVQPYPNNTICYAPFQASDFCNEIWNGERYLGFWTAWNCQPVFTCHNYTRYEGRMAFVCLMSIVLGVAHIGALLYIHLK